MKRRNFFRWVGASWFVSVLLNVTAAYSNQKGKSLSAIKKTVLLSDLPTRSDGFVVVGTATVLDQAGFLKIQIAGNPVLVIRDPAQKNTLRAVGQTCTHAGCLVDWNAEEKKLECPCHDSEFSIDGKVLQGPAKKALPIYPAKLENNTVLLKSN